VDDQRPRVSDERRLGQASFHLKQGKRYRIKMRTMAYVSWQLGRASIVDVTTVGRAAISAVALTRWRLNSAWLVLGGAAIGLVAHLVRSRSWLLVL
jgi:hypothetical protein